MSRIEDITRIEKLLKELNIDESKSQDLWEIFSHDGFDKEWLKTTDNDLQVAVEYIEKLESITREELVELNNPMLYFILWLVRVYKERK